MDLKRLTYRNISSNKKILLANTYSAQKHKIQSCYGYRYNQPQIEDERIGNPICPVRYALRMIAKINRSIDL